MFASILVALALFAAPVEPSTSVDDRGYVAVVDSTEEGTLEGDVGLVPLEEPAAEPTPDFDKLFGKDTTDPVKVVNDAVAAYKGKQWEFLAASVLSLLVWALRTFGVKSIPPKYLKHVVMVLSVVMPLMLALQTGGDPFSAVIGGVVLGLTTIGVWEYFGKPADEQIKKRRKKA